MLRQSGAPLGMYEAVMGWHLDVLKRQQVGTKPMVNQNALLKKLKKRYNMAHNTNIIYNQSSYLLCHHLLARSWKPNLEQSDAENLPIS
jgi:hypothetical protein